MKSKGTAIEESKDLTSLSLDELIGNLKVHKIIIKNDSEIVKEKVKRKSIALKAKKEYSNEECSPSGSEDEEYAMAVRDFKKFFKRKDKNQRAFVEGYWSDIGKEDDDKVKDETCLVAHASSESYEGNRYTLLIVDDYSRKIQNQLGCSIVSIRTDHGREFDNEVQFVEFCNANGITHNFSALRTPQSNGVVERKNRTLQEMSRIMLNEQALTQKFWCSAVDTSTYILNRILVRDILGKTPYKLLRGRKPTQDYFRAFGSKCFILNTKYYLTNFDPKSYEGVFLGYFQNSKAYIVLNKHTKKVKESLNVTFDETPPPFKTSPLVDDDLDEEEAIKVIEKNLENDIVDETLEIDEIVNIKESRNHPLENIIGNLNQRTLRSQAQNKIAQGYNQQEGIDYDETYALVARLESIRILLAYACALDFKLFQMDIKSAFLNSFINEEFEMSMMGELNFFLGLQFKQMEDGIFLNQSKYIKEMLKKFGLEDSKPIKTPMSSDTKLTKDEECKSVDSTKYRGMIAVKRIFRYIKGTTHLGLWYPKGTDIEIVVYAESDHAGDYVDRKSTRGIYTFVGCCLTSWFSKKQTALAISTTEAEYTFLKFLEYLVRVHVSLVTDGHLMSWYMVPLRKAHIKPTSLLPMISSHLFEKIKKVKSLSENLERIVAREDVVIPLPPPPSMNHLHLISTMMMMEIMKGPRVELIDIVKSRVGYSGSGVWRRGPCTRSETSLTLSWERITRLASGVRTTQKTIVRKEKHLKEDEEVSDNDEEVIYKIEVSANRPDLLCLDGLAQALRIFCGDDSAPKYKLADISKESMLKMHVKPETRQIRQFVVCAGLRGITFNEARYNSFSDLQNKLHQNTCRQKTLVSIGTHDLDTIEGPFTAVSILGLKKMFIGYCSSKKTLFIGKKTFGEGMAATKSFKDGLMEVEEKLEEIFTRFQKCYAQVRQEFSLRSDQNNKNTDCFKESVKEDSSKPKGNPTINEEDGTDSLREQGEDDWQPASENDLQNIQDTLDCCNLKPHMVLTQDDRARSKPSRCSYGPDLRCDHVLHLVVVQGLGSNNKSSGLEFHSTMILVLHLESNGLYGFLFGQRMTSDPGIRVIKILKQHLEDKSDVKLKKHLQKIVESPMFTVIYDRNRTVLSVPPIIDNGAHSAISLKTKNVFIECTATDRTRANIVLNTIVTMFSMYCERKFEIEPVEANEVAGLLNKMQLHVDEAVLEDKGKLTVHVPPNRSDVLHACDIAEDVAIAYGYNRLPRRKPTSVNPLSMNIFKDYNRDEMAMSGYLEVYHWKSWLNRTLTKIEVLRSSLMAGMLKVIAHNKDHPKPIKIFEVGDISLLDESKSVGARNQLQLAALYCGITSGFECIHGIVDNIMQVSGIPFVSPEDNTGYYIEPSYEPEFFVGRQASIICKGKRIGTFGIVHPQVLINFGIPDPCSLVELNLERLL
nr:phenylalanine--tRNA ligase beta subunit, cytoplasmic-like [Tanacetum cinerariifolium]